ncbi:F-box/LRR-repeat protein 12-like [Tachypleus tridentatus]|uniref:F-box/LRR-repeat protein 12-like n=1 Tax=Tachypleus tridentatus TaxID=6853 RepID=UPI003FD58DBC
MEITQNLPEVVLLKIFRLLQFGDLCRAGRVCKLWYQLTRSKTLWRFVDATDIKLTTQQLAKLVSRLTTAVNHLYICGLVLNEVPFLTPGLIAEISRNSPDLQTLVIEGAFVAKQINWTDITIQDLPPKLTTLSLRRSFFHADQLFCCTDSPSGPQLKCLDVSHCWCISDHDMPFFTKLSNLQELYLESCDYISDDGVFMFVSRSETLTVIDIEGTNISDDTLHIISERCPKLQKLFLGKTWVTDRGIMSLSDKAFPSLEMLCLSKTMVTITGIKYLCESQKTLKWLKISESKLLLQDVQDVMSVLPLCKVYRKQVTHFSSPESDICEHFLEKMFQLMQSSTIT